MERREFLKKACVICAALNSGILLSSLSSCASFPVYDTVINDKKISVPSSLFVKEKVQIIRANDFTYDIALEKQKDGSYLALLLRCTHASNQLNFTGNGFVCPLHGSNFDLRGGVTQGPAKRPLEKLKTQVMENNVIIYLS